MDEKQRLERAIEYKKKQASGLDSKQIGKPTKNKSQQGGRLSMQKPVGSKEKKHKQSCKNIEQRLENLDEVTPPTMERQVVFRQSQIIKLYNNYPIMGYNINKKLGDNHLFENAAITIPLAKKKLQ